MPAAAIAIPAAISGATSILGGVLGSSAASKSAQVQQQSIAQAIAQLQQQLGVVNPQILAAAKEAGTGLTGAAAAAGQNLTDVAAGGAAGITGAADAAAANLADVAGRGATGITTAAGGANDLLAPFISGGAQSFQTLAQLMAPGGDLSRTFTAADMQTLDPGYQFRIDQANKALQASAAAKGGALGGGTLRALDTLSQNNASAEMQNAFTRFQQQQQQRFNMLNSLAQTGLTAGTTAGGNMMTAAQQAAALLSGAAQQGGSWQLGGAQSVADLLRSAATQAGTWNFGGAQQTGQWNYGAAAQTGQNTLDTFRSIADMITSGGQAQAAGIMGSNNAWQGMLGGLGSAATTAGNAYQQSQLLNILRGRLTTPIVKV